MFCAVIDLTEMVRVAMQRPEHSALFRAWEAQKFTWVISEPMLREYIEVTERPRLRRFIRPMVRDAIVDALQTRAFSIVPAVDFPPCRDPKDNIVIATAVAASPCFLVTSDRDLYDDADLVARLDALAVEVIQAGEFLARLHV
ncbi:MAG: putative toxin-antitoxin system toxin component, PIN family [Anaerolineae bacterium]|nr:putative toxin-antitoxin system toxin component, PIN family [Anaerolineae bacterium]